MSYRDKDWLEDQYVNHERSTREIGKELNVSNKTIHNWLIKFNIKTRQQGKSLGMKDKKHSKETKEKISQSQIADKNHKWKGDNAGYTAIHIWLRNHNQQPEVCEICRKPGKLELSCIDHTYIRDIENYQWVCRSCHTKYDKEKGLVRT